MGVKKPSRRRGAGAPQRRLPGEPDRRQILDRILRVDHAGEYGAKRIYAGQIAVLGEGPQGPLLRHMERQELAHLQAFSEEMRRRRGRPTIFYPLWHLLGAALGAGPARLGAESAMAVTVAVEEVIDAHYARQEKLLERLGETALRRQIARFRAEEKEHEALARQNGAAQAPGYHLLRALVRAATKAAICLSERV